MADDEVLMEAVRRFECLWKARSRAYKDLRAKENAWKLVTDEVSFFTLCRFTTFHLCCIGG